MRFFLKTLFISILTFEAVIFFCMLSPPKIVQQNIKIDGVYRFKSERTTVNKPKALVTSRNSPEWTGFFFFNDGYFSISLMDQTREDDWFTKFPKNIDEVGFESFSGKYEVSKNTLILKPEIELHPFYDSRSRTFEIKIDSDTLTLTEKMHPYTEDIREGERIIILSKTKREID